MALNYDGLFNILKTKNISISQLSDDLNISSSTRAKFKKGEYVSLQTLESICRYLNVDINDVVEFIAPQNTSPLLQQLTEEMNHNIKGSIYHETQILLTYNSNHIEGSQLTPDQTRYIYETNTIGVDKETAVNIDDIIETQNHFRCVDTAIKSALEPLSESWIKDLHSQLKTGTSDARLDWFSVGDYKQRPNTVGGKETALPKDVETHMKTLIKTYESKKTIAFRDIIAFHYQFETIHPFQDGNGRVGRLIAFKECLRHGFVPFTIDESIKIFYYRGLREWTHDEGYLMDTCLSGQDTYKKLLEMYDIKY